MVGLYLKVILTAKSPTKAQNTKNLVLNRPQKGYNYSNES